MTALVLVFINRADCFLAFLAVLRALRADDIDCSSVEQVLDVRCVEFLNHFDAGAAILGERVDIRALHEAHANVGVTQTVCGTFLAVAIKLELGAIEDAVEKFDVVARKDMIRRFRQL